MNKFRREAVKVRILKLASLKGTGTPVDLAFRYDIGVRSVKRYIKEMRDDGIDIRFSQSARSYVTGGDFM